MEHPLIVPVNGLWDKAVMLIIDSGRHPKYREYIIYIFKKRKG